MRKGRKITKETREKISKTMKGRPGRIWSEEEKRKRSDARRGTTLSEETKKKIGISNSGKVRSRRTRIILSIINSGNSRPCSEETKRKISIANKGQISHNKGKKFSEETRRKMSIFAKERFADPRNCPNWQGGISAEPYCDVWKDKEYKKDIKARDEYECQNPNCDATTDLMVHHIDYAKKNCHPLNLITLCRGCNTRANYNKDYWKLIYQNVVHEKEEKAA